MSRSPLLRARRRLGFTLIEIVVVVVVAIIGILATAALPLQQMALRRSQEAARREALRSVPRDPFADPALPAAES